MKEIYVDGSLTQTCHILPDGEAVLTPLPQGTTVNEAEYHAILFALHDILKYQVSLNSSIRASNSELITIYTDSEVVQHQISLEYGCKAPNLKPLLAQTLKLMRELAPIQVFHIPREQNKAGIVLEKMA